jgi:hypothetical protein
MVFWYPQIKNNAGTSCRIELDGGSTYSVAADGRVFHTKCCHAHGALKCT